MGYVHIGIHTLSEHVWRILKLQFNFMFLSLAFIIIVALATITVSAFIVSVIDLVIYISIQGGIQARKVFLEFLNWILTPGFYTEFRVESI